jgi:hemerythrin-like domain-containing protein
MKSISSKLENMEDGNDNWISKIKELNDAVNHHLRKEENNVFPAAQKVLSEDQARDIGQQ